MSIGLLESMNCVPGPLRLCPQVKEIWKNQLEFDRNPKNIMDLQKMLPVTLGFHVQFQCLLSGITPREQYTMVRRMQRGQWSGDSWILISYKAPAKHFVLRFSHQSMSAMFGSKVGWTNSRHEKPCLDHLGSNSNHGEAIFDLHVRFTCKSACD